MKRFISGIAALLTLLSLLPMLIIPASADEYPDNWSGDGDYSLLIDDIDIFSDDQEARINERISECSDQLKINISIFLAGPDSRVDDDDVVGFADQTYDDIYGIFTDGVLCYLDLTGKDPAYSYLSTSGVGRDFYEDHRREIIEGIEEYLPEPGISDYREYRYDIQDGIYYLLDRLLEYGEAAAADKGDNVIFVDRDYVDTYAPDEPDKSGDVDDYYDGAHAQGSAKVTFVDNADIFDSKQEQEIIDEITEYAESLDLNICIFVAGGNYYMSDSQTEIFADDEYDEIYGEDTDGVFYFMDFTGKRPAFDYISTSGKAVLFYQKHIDDIFSGMDNYLPPSSVSNYRDYSYDIQAGISYFLEQLERYDGAKGGFLEYYYDESSGKYFYYKHGKLVITKKIPPAKRLKFLGLGLIAGVIAWLLMFFITKSNYRFKSSTNASVYIAREEIQKQQWSDTFIRTYTTKVKIESSSGGGSRGGGGGHHHSGGHGGGGHHR